MQTLSSLFSLAVADSGGMVGAGLSSKFTIGKLLSEAIVTLPFKRVKYGWEARLPQTNHLEYILACHMQQTR